jgi:predicted MFS family arabinose efflux permease
MLPGNVLLRSVPPWLLIGGAIVTFGTFLCCMAAAPNYQTVLALRIMIGLAQALVQGIGLYASLWYRRNELATRGGM